MDRKRRIWKVKRSLIRKREMEEEKLEIMEENKKGRGYGSGRGTRREEDGKKGIDFLFE